METYVGSKILLLEEQLENKIALGFHQALNKSEQQYRENFNNALENAKVLRKRMENDFGFPVLVEPRIPFRRQLELMKIDIDQAVFYEPLHFPNARPYAIWVSSFDHLISLPKPYRDAMPLEGIQIKIPDSFRGFPVTTLDGGKYERLPYAPDSKRARVLVLENFLGKYRVGQIHRYEICDRLGRLACFWGNKSG